MNKGRKPRKRRHPDWPTVRARHLEDHPACEACGQTEQVEVHHIVPFHLDPELELEPTNLLTLCEGRGAQNCHLALGHLYHWRSYNRRVREDAKRYRKRISSRPVVPWEPR